MIAEIKGIYKKIDNKEIINNINFTIGENEIVALVGPNGAGKTTLLKLVSNLIFPDEGSIKICNLNPSKNREQALAKISFMQDSSVLYPDLTGYDHLFFIAKVKDIPLSKINKVIKKLKIEKYINLKVRKYSLGMKQHLLLAISLLSKPKLLLMDEPLNGLDPSSSLLLRQLILELRDEGTSILFSSHILGEVDKVADRILFIREGQIVEEKSSENFKCKKNSYLLKITKPEEVRNILKSESNINELVILDCGEIQLTLIEPDLREIIKKLYDNHIFIIDIHKTEQRTETIYHSIYGD
ncbi:ABC transporter ATP-binding protein [Neobacillus terrae]|uniref:ABC transporter ATP-binding protein n=1 Tax=Neobacillus terrae TaxID=3034837 RepID=UPI00140A5D1D|nr:ABC transporter ATP-binding protein [Neobacillus terrae]NHM31280.1 ABC transporter ATP-binding protein [Neobacillus terrae]